MIKNNRLILSLLLWIGAVVTAHAQTTDTLTLSYAEYIRLVLAHHPVSHNADLQVYEGKANLLYARGGFDPKLFANLQEKYFEEKQYYSKVHGGLKIPLWFGLELQGGYEQNEGTFLNSADNTPASGLMYAGITANLGQGLFIDKRRLELKKAKLYRDITESEKELMLNQLVFEAGQAYWQWFKAYNYVKIYRRAFQVAKERYDGIKEMAHIGEIPTIDTVEAAIQLQNRSYNLQQAEVDYKNASALVSVYLWEDGVVPLEVAATTLPDGEQQVTDAPLPPNFMATDTLWSVHPDLVKTGLKIGQIELEKRWRAELIKPVIRLKYNPITEYTGLGAIQSFNFNNYTLGLEFLMPILWRKERGALKLYDIKLEQMQNSFRQKQQMVKFKVSAAVNQLQTLQGQIGVYADIVKNYYTLLQGENALFNNGESSLFMINAREMGYFNARVKLVELIAKRKETELKVKYHLGRAHRP